MAGSLLFYNNRQKTETDRDRQRQTDTNCLVKQTFTANKIKQQNKKKIQTQKQKHNLDHFINALVGVWKNEADWKELKKKNLNEYNRASEFCDFVFNNFLPNISTTVTNILGKDSCPVLSQMKWNYLDYLNENNINVGKYVVLDCRSASKDFCDIVKTKFTKKEQNTLICKEPFSYSGFSLSIKKPTQPLERWLSSRMEAARLRKCPFIIVQRCAKSRLEIKINFFDGQFLGATSCDDVLEGAAVKVLNRIPEKLERFLLGKALPVIYAANSPFSGKGAIRIDCLEDVDEKWFILEVENVSAGMTVGNFPQLYTNFYHDLFVALSFSCLL